MTAGRSAWPSHRAGHGAGQRWQGRGRWCPPVRPSCAVRPGSLGRLPNVQDLPERKRAESPRRADRGPWSGARATSERMSVPRAGRYRLIDVRFCRCECECQGQWPRMTGRRSFEGMSMDFSASWLSGGARSSLFVEVLRDVGYVLSTLIRGLTSKVNVLPDANADDQECRCVCYSNAHSADSIECADQTVVPIVNPKRADIQEQPYCRKQSNCDQAVC